MDSLPPIPSPPGQYWREFRIRVVPMLVFLIALIAVVITWRNKVSAPTLVGEVEVIRENVTSPKPGLLAELNVASFQQVKAGDPVAQVITTDPKILASTLAVIQADIALLRLNLQPVLGQQRYTLSYERAQLDWMQQRVDLVTARGRLQSAETELRRTEELFKDKIVSEKVFDQARLNKEKLETEVEARQKLVADMEKTLQQLRLTEDSTQTPMARAEDTMNASIAVQEEKLRLAENELRPITLKVPMDGMISMVHRRSGETIMAGEPILTISALSSYRIIGYLRQPVAIEPKVGMPVRISTRSPKRQVSRSKIIQVGAQMEPINTALLPAINPRVVETGLPILVSLPDGMKLLPGEIVDLTLMP